MNVEPQENPSEPVGSYAQVTAARLLERFGVKISGQGVREQLKDPSSFYRAIISAAAKTLHGKLLLERCRELQNFIQQELVNIIFQSHQGGYTPPGDIQHELDKLKENYEARSNRVKGINNTLEQLEKIMDEKAQANIEEWQELQSKHAKAIIDALHQQGYPTSSSFEKRLEHHLNTTTNMQAIPEDILQELKMAGSLNRTTRAVITALIEEKKHARF